MSDHSEIREAVRRFAREQLAPNAARWDREREFPREALKGLAAMGLYGIAIAEEFRPNTEELRAITIRNS